MKRFLLLLLAVVLLSSCSDFDRFLSGLDGEVVAPVASGSIIENAEGIDILAGCLLIEIVDAGHENDANYLRPEAVLVINDPAQLKDVTYKGVTYSWPDINLQKYSLVIGRIGVPDGGSYIAKHRIEKKNTKLLFYAEIRSNGGTARPERRIIATLYPKLPDLPVEIVRWNRD